MIEVIKHGKKKFTATCSNCGCEFTYELSDMKPLGGVDCPDCGHHVVHPNLGNNNGGLYYPSNCRRDVEKSFVCDVYTTEKDLEIQQVFKDQMSKKMAIPCVDKE